MTSAGPDAKSELHYTPDATRDPNNLPLRDTFHFLRRLTHEVAIAWQQLQPNITKTQYVVLYVIDAVPGIEQIHLGMDTACSKASLAELLNRLEKRGLITRKQDPADRRRRMVFITPEGKKLLDESRPTTRSIDDIFLSRLTDTERRQFHAMLVKMLTYRE